MPLSFSVNRRHFPVVVPPHKKGTKSVLAFSMAKGGSTLLYDMLLTTAPLVNLTYMSVDDILFASNVASNNRPTDIGNVFFEEGMCYGGFRQFPAYPIPILGRCKAILLVRDPRDMMVSLYFSHLISHKIPESEATGGSATQLTRARDYARDMSLNDWIIYNVTGYVRMFEGYVSQGFLWRPNVRIYRYEDVIYDKAAWLEDIADWFDWDIDPKVLGGIASQFDLIPQAADPTKHIRQVHPGGYKDHLDSHGIMRIQSQLSEYMRIFNYV